MKTRNFFLASLLILAVSSCQSLFDEDSSRVVKFSVSVKNDRTKVHYSGDVDESGLERIEWDNDDLVDIFMFWDGFGYDDPDHDWRTYIIEHQGHGENDHIDRGTLHTEGAEELRWKGDATQGDVIKHYFYGVYPAGAGNVSRDKTDGTISVNFDLRANANEMKKYAYMAAGGKKDPIVTAESYDKAVELDFYPMVTTLYVTLKNGAKKSGPIELRIAPSSKNTSNPLYGSYSARYDQSGKRFVTVDTAEESVGENQVSSTSVNVGINETVSIPFFIRPRAYAKEEVTLTVGDKSYDLPVGFDPCHKYNITVNLKDEGQLTIDDLTPAGLQLAFAFLRYGTVHVKNEWWEGYGHIDGNFLAPYFQELYPDHNVFLSDCWKRLEKIGDKLPEVTKEDRDLLTDEEWQVIMYFLSTIDELIIETGSYINASLTEKDLGFLPNLEVLRLQYNDTSKDDDGGINISLSQMPKLREVKLQGNSLINLTINSCVNLETVDFSALHSSKAYKVTIDGCTKLTTVVDIPNNNVWKKKITNCNSSVNTE